MRRRKHKRMGSMSIMCITAIVGLSAMGVGYGYWNDSLNIGVSVSTGNTDPQINLKSFEIIQEDGQLLLSLSEDKRTLSIEGWAYPSFNESIGIDVIDIGSVPVVLDGIDIDIKNENIGLMDIGSVPVVLNSMHRDINNEDLGFVESGRYFNLNINSAINNIEQPFLNNQGDYGVYGLIQSLDTVKDQSFKYRIRFKQGL